MGVFKIKKKRLDNKDIYAMISIVAFILVLSFALNTVHTTDAILNDINSPSGMASLSLNETKENKITNEEPILIKNGTTKIMSLWVVGVEVGVPDRVVVELRVTQNALHPKLAV